MNNQILTPADVVKVYPALTRSTGSLANWRHKKQGPKFYKLKQKVVYRAEDIEDYLFRNPVLTRDSV
ncbi:MAG TPA: DNA-binding protein [Deltaproteobacteria bacterium]|nr:DNA-binding protein [Deltaproteobacteria bacterium]OPX38330.1 MAG: hypothetical protein B1H11_04685 [Desulfobacteraceae bacterium 4484_190.1]HDM77740.1 DNA-binding protein [Deltaproteobacteria bacterium]